MTSTSSGFIATDGKKRWLLTNAHSVDYHTQVGHRHSIYDFGDSREYCFRLF
jgi:hypothetical protein